MKIEINISKKTANHIKSPHTFYDCCSEAEEILKKVQKQIDKKILKNNVESKSKVFISGHYTTKIINGKKMRVWIPRHYEEIK